MNFLITPRDIELVMGLTHPYKQYSPLKKNIITKFISIASELRKFKKYSIRCLYKISHYRLHFVIDYTNAYC